MRWQMTISSPSFHFCTISGIKGDRVLQIGGDVDDYVAGRLGQACDNWAIWPKLRVKDFGSASRSVIKSSSEPSVEPSATKATPLEDCDAEGDLQLCPFSQRRKMLAQKSG